MTVQLSDLGLRIIGALIEKQLATPQAYPLSVNALTAAANQTTNREPVTSYSEAEISTGLRELSAQSLVTAVYARRSSTPRYAHQLDDHLEVDTPGTAVLAVLALRGPQTLGELRQRTERLHPFGSTAEVADVLAGLAAHHYGQLVEELPRQPGQKEARWRHLLGGGDQPTGSAATPEPPPPAREDVAVEAEAEGGAVAELRTEVAELREEVTDLRRTVDDLRDRLDRALGS
ncbi:YceH family protein [Euzebya sp.]|uniref:YceH family protein n=1 Tax=Euzebya sp. TaxID=1971409 RepID=UPI0035143BFA